MSALLLLADSQLLFRPAQLPMLTRRFAPRLGMEPPFNAAYINAAYIGASNGNQPAFFELACSALETLFGRPVPCRFIRTTAEVPAQPCELVILAGGSVTLGWEFLQQAAVIHWLESCRQLPDTVFIGVSAGAIHLTNGCDPEVEQPSVSRFLDWAPLFVAVHEEVQQATRQQVQREKPEPWPSRQLWQRQQGQAGVQTPDFSDPTFIDLTFAGLPMGSGLWWENGVARSVGKPGLQWQGAAVLAAPDQPDQQQ